MTDDLQTIFLADYQPPNFQVEKLNLVFDLFDDGTIVKASYRLAKSHTSLPSELRLYGEALELLSLKVDGQGLTEDQYVRDHTGILLQGCQDAFLLEIETKIYPEKNTSLSGLYRSSGMYCTQCEAEGFRRITFYPDRPDVMTCFTTTIQADLSRYPVLLSNGNLIDKGMLDNGRHYATWEDPFKKPSYLFAMVAGDLLAVEDHFQTQSGRLVTLKIFVERENIDKCAFAMESLKKAMRWDEKTYGREYDLDIYMIVAVNDFNMGAMENKGLNIFNAQYVLARPETATDYDFDLIDAVVGHEYFHNWSGNRVTCRDWFQLSLKEGFTVFREQQFSREISKSPISRIEQVNLLRAKQFTEDASPMAHPVQPASYLEINNFYTMTVYEKGAEVIRMIANLLGPEDFRRGCDLYFERHDGQAVTCDDFMQAMQEVSGFDFGQFKLWYTQAGTPLVNVTEAYDAAKKQYHLTLSQTVPETLGQSNKKPMHIPIQMALFAPTGEMMTSQLNGVTKPSTTHVLSLTKPQQAFVFEHVEHQPVLSFLRDFSAPVRVKRDIHEKQLAFLIKYETDDFNRWDAAQSFFTQTIFNAVQANEAKQVVQFPPLLLEALFDVVNGESLSPAQKSVLLQLPSVDVLLDAMEVAKPDELLVARHALLNEMSEQFYQPFQQLYDEHLTPGPYQYEPQAVGKRALKNLMLAYLVWHHEDAYALCESQYLNANNMTDQWGALKAINAIDCGLRKRLLDDFYQRWSHDPLIINKWLSLHATAELPSTLSTVKQLLSHPAFDMTNPNKVRALIGSFCMQNKLMFHDKSGQGYAFLTEMIMQLDTLNPQVAARLVSPLSQWRTFDLQRQTLMRQALETLQKQPKLSKDVHEIVNKSLMDLEAKKVCQA